MKRIVFLSEYCGARRGWTADVDDKLAYELVEQGVAIISKDMEAPKNKMMTNLYEKK